MGQGEKQFFLPHFFICQQKIEEGKIWDKFSQLDEGL